MNDIIPDDALFVYMYVLVIHFGILFHYYIIPFPSTHIYYK